MYTARSKTNGEVVAVKTMSVGDMFESEVANVRREVEILRRLQHPNIVRVLEMFDDTWDGELHVVMELCSESLVGRLQEEDSARDGRASSSGERGYDERRVASLFRQLLRAVWYCHSNGVVHRDIKLSNLTYSTAALPGAELRLIDFGLAKQYDGTDALQERVGTPAYLAPELLGPPPLAYDSKVDLWACGVVLYQLLCGALPFEAPDGSAREQRRRIREEPLSLDGAAWADVSEAATDLVRKLLRKEADHRPPASAALEHAWLAEEAPTGQRLPRSVLRSLLAFSQASELKKLAFEAAAASAPQESLRDAQPDLGGARRRLGLALVRAMAGARGRPPPRAHAAIGRASLRADGWRRQAGDLPRLRQCGDHVPRAVAHAAVGVRAPRRRRRRPREREGRREAGAAAGEPPQRQPPQRRRRRR